MKTSQFFEQLENRSLFSASAVDGAHPIDTGFSPSYPQIVNVVNNKVIFVAQDADRHGRLYTYDPVSQTAVLLRDIHVIGSAGQQGVVIDDTLYFSAVEGLSNKLFKTDGTPEGTVVVSGTNHA